MGRNPKNIVSDCCWNGVSGAIGAGKTTLVIIIESGLSPTEGLTLIIKFGLSAVMISIGNF
ncbi:hypothetical protein DN393_30120 [Bacillus sp. BPN334]|nr:hypothetical protein DN393_30120 [Bacillus sp. BPN334]